MQSQKEPRRPVYDRMVYNITGEKTFLAAPTNLEVKRLSKWNIEFLVTAA